MTGPMIQVEAKEAALQQEEKTKAIELWSENFAIETDEDFSQADRAVGRMNEIKKGIETSRDKICVPAYESWKEALAFFNPYVDRCVSGIKRTKKKMDAYREKKRLAAEAEERRQQAILDEERAKAQKEIDDAEAAAKAEADDAQAELLRQEAEQKQAALNMAPAVVEPIDAEPPATENTTTRKVWKFEIEDESLIPHEFRICKPDTGKIRDHMNDYHERANVPGVRFFQSDDTALVGRRR